MWVEFVGYLFCSERFFSGYSGFNTIHRVNNYPLDSAIVFAMTYSLDSDFIQRIMLFLTVTACKIGRNRYFAGMDQRTGSGVWWGLWVICRTNSEPKYLSSCDVTELTSCVVSDWVVKSKCAIPRLNNWGQLAVLQGQRRPGTLSNFSRWMEWEPWDFVL